MAVKPFFSIITVKDDKFSFRSVDSTKCRQCDSTPIPVPKSKVPVKKSNSIQISHCFCPFVSRLGVKVMSYEVQKLLKILSTTHNSREEKVALILLIKQLAIDKADIPVVLTKAVDSLTPTFIINMLLRPSTTSVISKGHEVCEEAATWLLETMISISPELIAKFASCIEGLTACLMQYIESTTVDPSLSSLSSSPQLRLIVSIFKLIFATNTSDLQHLQHVIVTIISKFAVTNCTKPILILEILVALSDINGCKSRYKLDSACNSALRALCIQCLHGAAPEATRDHGLQYIHELCISRIIDPSWTIENDGNDVGKFVLLLMSVLRGELHLLYEEILCKYDVTEVKESTAASSSYIDTAIANVNKNIEKRNERIYRMINTCCNLLDTTLLLLIGDEEGEAIPVWSELPGKVIGSIRSINHGIINEMLDFMTQVSGIKDRIGIMQVVTRVLQALGKWAVEDDDLLQLFIDKLPFISLIVLPYVDSSELQVSNALVTIVQHVLVIVERYNAEEDTEALHGRDHICSTDKLFPLLIQTLYYHMNTSKTELLLPTLEALIVLINWKLADLKVLLRSKDSHESLDTVIYQVFSKGCSTSISFTSTTRVVTDYVSSHEWSSNDAVNEVLYMSQQLIDLVSQIL